MCIYQIPLMKRNLETICLGCFLILFSYVALSDPCGPLRATDLALLIWICGYAVDEMYTFLMDRRLYMRGPLAAIRGDAVYRLPGA